MTDLLCLPKPSLWYGIANDDSVKRMTVSIRHRANIIGGLRASFNLQAGNPCPQQIREMLDHAHVPTVQQKCAAVFNNLKYLSRTFLLHKSIFPSAGLSTAASISIASGHVIGQQAASGKGYAHCAVNKRLKLKLFRRIGANGSDLIQMQFPRKHHSGGAKVMKRTCGSRIDHAELCADMKRNMRRITLYHAHHTKVGSNYRIHANVFQELQKRRKTQ